jgi:hypothetical protein
LESLTIVDICHKSQRNIKIKFTQPFSFLSTVLALHCRIVEQRGAPPSTRAVDNCLLLINLTVFIIKRLFTKIESILVRTGPGPAQAALGYRENGAEEYILEKMSY